MAGQKEIAQALGITQAAVSMALRNHPRISAELREKVFAAAKRMGYRPNVYVNALMTSVRAGKKPGNYGAIGLLIEDRSLDDWQIIDSRTIFYQGVLQKAEEIGFHIQPFFLHEPGLKIKRIDQILQARGISGLILAPPYHSNRSLLLDWNRYAAIGVGFGWEEQDLHRVVYDTLQNYLIAFDQLRKKGYRRIGTVLGPTLVQQTHHAGIRSYNGYLECQDRISQQERIPVFIRNTPPLGVVLTESTERRLISEFKQWINQWKPDSLLTMMGFEKKWLDLLSIRVPDDIGMACLVRPADKDYAGVDENGKAIGAAAVELVAAQIYRNEFGPPEIPRTTMIEGRWVDGSTIRKQAAG